MSFGAFPVEFPKAEWLLDHGRRLEQCGFDTLLIGDRPLWAAPHFEPISLLGALSATTIQARLVAVLLLPLRHPVLLARQAAFTDYLSGGRLTIAAAIGGDYEEEFEALGVPSSERVTRHNECVAALRHAWSGVPASFQGAFTEFPGGRIRPSPVEQRAPIWLAHRARTDSSVRRTVELGDGWLASWVTERRFGETVHRMEEHADRTGRDIDDLELAALVRFYLTDDVDAGIELTARFRERTYGHSPDPAFSRQFLALGDAANCLERLQAYVAAGADTLILQPECALAEIDEQIDRFVADVLPELAGPSIGRP